MKHAKSFITKFLRVCMCGTFWMLGSELAAAAEIDWQKYMQSSKNVSAIAAAVSWVDNCGKKLEIVESITERTIRLDFICNDGGHGETGSIEFDRFGDDGLIPMKFTWAG